ncbi:MAG: type I restriction-modification system subunit M [Selenomonadaceae bacterium]|nr:type I restriction-modification system subunit M [Selenomonadaceae bacterium]
MAINDNVNTGFEENLWKAACVLWGHIPAADYRKVIVGLIFLRYISYAFEKRFNELVAEGDGFENDPDAYAEENVFFVPKNARWSKIAVAAHTPEIGSVIDDAMRAIEADNKKLKNVLPKNYSNPDLDKRVLGEVVDMFTNIKISDSASKDLLGRTYEYCIAPFAAYEGVKGGEFYTPSSIVKIIVSVLRPFSNCRVYDPCCGSGGMFIQSERFIQAHSGKRGTISIFGQESNADTWKMAKMNLAIRGIDANLGEYHADTFFNDLHPTLKADFIMANPPFNLKDWGQDKLKDDRRWRYGLPPAGNANYAWIQHMLSHLAPNGKIGLVLANGALSTQTGGEGEIRRKIIEDDLIEGIVALPTQLFYSVTIPVTLWFISKNKKQKGKTLFIDARKMGSMVDRKHRAFSEADTKKIADTFAEFQAGTLESVKGFCAVAGLDDIKQQDYILTPGRYVGIEEQEDDDELFEEKMQRLVDELSNMFSKSHALEDKIRDNLAAIGYDL